MKIICRFLSKGIRRYLFSYCLIVLVFAVINWFLFLNNSTSFLISNQLNKHVDGYELWDPDIDLSTFHRDAKDIKPITIDDFVAIVKWDFDDLDSINSALCLRQNRLDTCRFELSNFYKIVDEKRANAIDAFGDSILHESQQKIDSLRIYMLGRDSTELLLEGKYVELANLQVAYAKKAAEVATYVVEHFSSFIPDSLLDNLGQLSDEETLLTTEIQSLENKRREVSSDIEKSIKMFHQNRRDVVGFGDFLYYSVCVSTTVSFGDIAPNDGWTRFTAILELLSCLILVGVIIDKINKMVYRNHADG